MGNAKLAEQLHELRPVVSNEVARVHSSPGNDADGAPSGAPSRFGNRDFEHTIWLAEAAIDLIKMHALPADPPSFEIWYMYAGRFMPALNKALNRLLKNAGKISSADVDQIYDRYISQLRFGDQIGVIGERLGGQLGDILSTMDAAIGTSNWYGAELALIDEQLGRLTKTEALRAIIQVLAQATAHVEEQNQAFEERLKAARAEIELLRSGLQAIYTESRSDPLTRLVNRRCFDQALQAAVSHAQATGEPLSLLMCDVDHFKAVNDAYGHPIGDDVLRLIASTVKRLVRAQDTAARYGGEEFAVILPDAALPEATNIAKRICEAVADREIIIRSTGQRVGRVTISIGAALLANGEDARGLIERADQCLYRAKREGRNRVVALD